mmetsp:Transcript_26305/g.39123  ORF Transcript_26305/g.39123 Transcript_26305/m.39123 type:complete len:345 (-) Transcript_26305:4750-5784(-)
MSIPIPNFQAFTPQKHRSDDNSDGKDDDDDEGRLSPDANVQQMMSASPATKMKRRRELNIQRNEARLKALGLTQNNNTTKKKTNVSRKRVKSEVQVKRGMKRNRGAHATAVCTSLHDIENRWPHRSKQIQLLGRSLEAPLLALKRSNISIGHNHPIVVLGPSGTGKSGIVREVLGMLRQKYPTNLGYAYIDGSLCVSPADIYGSALRQILNSFEGEVGDRNLSRVHLKNNTDEWFDDANATASSAKSGISNKSKSMSRQIISASSSTLFARKLSMNLGPNRTAILVIDNAEHVISFGSAGIRVLAQLMMLSSEMNVNFRVISVSRKHYILNSSVCKYICPNCPF